MEITFHDKREFQRWFHRLAANDQARVITSINDLQNAARPLPMPHGRNLGSGLHELRPSSGRATQRLYYAVHGQQVILLCAGRKDTQDRDIDRARRRIT
jgi:putative addiction module killer protein